MTYTRARSEIVQECDRDVAFGRYSPDRPAVRADLRYVRRSAAVSVAIEMSRLSRSVVLALQDGAHSARNGDTSTLTYADGWAAAATLAQLVAFDSVKPPAE